MNKKMWFIFQQSFLLAVLLWQILIGVDSCPAEVCICKWKGGKQTVECGGQSLPNIPEGMDPGTQVLNFSGNALQVLQSERFLRMDLLNLQKIYLSRNQLIRIHEKAFRGLSNLVELDLAENALQHIPTETFQDYSSLMRLSLSGNPIRDLKAAAFRYLSFLTTLELSNCQIERIENEAFVGMDNLEWLRLDGNRISYIEGNHILPKSLHGISLQMNRWACDCRLLDLHYWLNSYNTPQSEEPKCVKPSRLKGHYIKTLQRSQFACLPEVMPQSTYTEISEGRNLSISCTVRAIPEPKVMWLFNGQVMTNDSLLDNLHLYYYIDESSGVAEEKRSEIFIYNVGVENNGTFSCVGQNVAGTIFSNYTIRVIIKEPPIVNEVSFPHNYMNYILASITGGSLIFLILLCTIIVKCKQKNVSGKKCVGTVVTSVNGNSNSSSDGNNTNDTGLMKCSSILNDNDSTNGTSGLILNSGDSMTPTKRSKENGIILGNHMKQNIMLYAPLEGSNQTLQLSVNLASATAALAPCSNTPPPTLLPPSLMVNPAISNSLAYCSPPASLRNYVEKNPDLVNDAESGVKHKLKISTSLDAATSNYDASNDHSIPVQYEQFYQLSPQFDSQVIRPNLTVPSAANSCFAAMTTLPRGVQFKTVMNSLPSHPVDMHLNPVCFLGQDTFAYDYSNSHMQQSPSQMTSAHHHLLHQTSQQQQQQHQQLQQSYLTSTQHQQQNYCRTLPHNRSHRQQQQQQQQKPISGSTIPATKVSTPNGGRYILEAELLQRTSATNYESLASPTMRCTVEGYPHHTHPSQYPSPPEGYKSTTLSPRAINENSIVGLQQWPSCLPGYHVQGIRYSSTLMPNTSTAMYTTNNSPQQQQSFVESKESIEANNNSYVNVKTQTVASAESVASPNLTIVSSTNQTVTTTAATALTATAIATATTTTTVNIITAQNPESRKPMHCAASQADIATVNIIPECEEIDISLSENNECDTMRIGKVQETLELLTSTTTPATPSTERTKAAAATTIKTNNKKRHLNGPLADSPDEGYVDDAHEPGDI